MTKKQIIICFSDGRYLFDFITVNEGNTEQEALDAYMTQYEHIQNSMEIVKNLLPSIIHISFMENK